MPGLRGPNAIDGLRGPNAIDGLRGPNAIDRLRGPNAIDGLRGPDATKGPVWAVVVAAGSGARYGARKQYEPFGDKRVLDWSVAAARTVAVGVVLVVPSDRVDDVEKDVDALVGGGATRSASVRAGLAAVPPEAEVIVVHDAARPRATPGLFAAVVAALAEGVDAVVPALALTDTVKQVRHGRVVTTVERAELVTVQTPQAFRAATLRAAHAGADDATDDAALVEAMGGVVVVVPGEAGNIKITTPADR